MAKLQDKIDNALNEGRMLILGAEVLLGFQYRSVFESGFDRLPRATQDLKVVALGLMLVAVALLLWPGAYHRIVENGEDSERLHRFTTGVLGVALLPFALALGIDLYAATEKVTGQAGGVIAGVSAALVAFTLWYGVEARDRGRCRAQIEEAGRMAADQEGREPAGTPVKDKIKHVLTEARVVLPGAQALLGFQFATMLVEGFDKLPQSSKYAHLASLALIALSTVLLMMPAAYHRIVEQGEETERFHRVATRIVLAAMVPLALGIAGDFFVVVRKVSGSAQTGTAAATLTLAMCYGLWFGYPAYRRRQAPARPAGRGARRPAAG